MKLPAADGATDENAEGMHVMVSVVDETMAQGRPPSVTTFDCGVAEKPPPLMVRREPPPYPDDCADSAWIVG